MSGTVCLKPERLRECGRGGSERLLSPTSSYMVATGRVWPSADGTTAAAATAATATASTAQTPVAVKLHEGVGQQSLVRARPLSRKVRGGSGVVVGPGTGGWKGRNRRVKGAAATLTANDIGRCRRVRCALNGRESARTPPAPPQCGFSLLLLVVLRGVHTRQES